MAQANERVPIVFHMDVFPWEAPTVPGARAQHGSTAQWDGLAGGALVTTSQNRRKGLDSRPG